MKLKITILSPPPGIDYALQSGKGNDYTVLQKQRSKGKDLSFDFTLDALRGPLVQGPAGGKFVYIDIGGSAGQHDTEIRRRLKVQLPTEITDESVVIKLPGTAKDGTPTCATLKPFPGWVKE